MQQVSIRTNAINCRGCERPSVAADCEHCGAAQTPRTGARISGALLASFGGILAGGTVWLIIAVCDVIAQIQRFVALESYTGTPTQKTIAFALFGALLVFGAWCFVGGIIQIASGKRVRGLRTVSIFLDAAASFVVETLLFF